MFFVVEDVVPLILVETIDRGAMKNSSHKNTLAVNEGNLKCPFPSKSDGPMENSDERGHFCFPTHDRYREPH